MGSVGRHWGLFSDFQKEACQSLSGMEDKSLANFCDSVSRASTLGLFEDAPEYLIGGASIFAFAVELLAPFSNDGQFFV